MAFEIVADVEYRDIPDFPGYRAGSDGTIWTRWEMGGAKGMPRGTRGRRLGNTWQKRKLQIRHDGAYQRLFVGLIDANGIIRSRPVSRFVLETFVGKRPPGLECCHDNGNSLDNRLSNLRWDTKKSNDLDKQRHGTVAKPNAKLTPENIVMIRQLRAMNKTAKELAQMFGVTTVTINCVLRGVTWKSVA